MLVTSILHFIFVFALVHFLDLLFAKHIFTLLAMDRTPVYNTLAEVTTILNQFSETEPNTPINSDTVSSHATSTRPLLTANSLLSTPSSLATPHSSIICRHVRQQCRPRRPPMHTP